ncbi:MAG: hypothetical protein ACFE8O_04695 [Candidatus Hermodarchaeota archaeon]
MKIVIPGRREVALQLDILQLSLLVIILIPIVLAMLYQLIIMFTSTGRKRTLAILGFLIAFFLMLTHTIFVFAMYQPLYSWQTLYYYILWGLFAVSQFFLVYYVTILAFPDFFNQHKWTIILPAIGLIAYEIIVIFRIPGGSVYWSFLIYNVIYLLIIPLISTYHYLRLDRIRGTPRVKWILTITLGVFLWFISYAMMSVLLIMYPTILIPPGSEIVFAILALAWWIILIVSFMDSRVGRQSTD